MTNTTDCIMCKSENNMYNAADYIMNSAADTL